jgi:hypothetical protein
MTLKIVDFPAQNISDIPNALRTLADNIEAGDFGDAHNIAWVIDKGEGQISIGLLGQCSEPGTNAYFLFGLGMRHIESI